MIGVHASLACLLFALVFTAIGQLFFRLHYVRTKKTYLAVALGMFASVPLLSYLALLNLTLAFVYMSTALIHVLVLTMSHLFLKERITGKQFSSISLIIIGIIVFNF